MLEDEDAIIRAIHQRHVVEFRLKGLLRVAEPHVYGIRAGTRQVLVYQIGGETRSGGLPAWRNADLDAIEELRVLGDLFEPRNPVMHGWTKILAEVKPLRLVR